MKGVSATGSGSNQRADSARWLLVVFIIAGLLSVACNRQKAAVQYARDLVEAGEFERALEMMNRVDRHENVPELDGLRGRVLSLVPSTMVDGMFLMNATVDVLDDPELRRDLFIFYLDTDQSEKAGQLVSGERLGPDRFFRQDAVILRNAYRCLAAPDVEKARRIIQSAGEKKEDAFAAGVRDEADTLALLCLGRSLVKYSGEKEASWVLDDKKKEAVAGKTGVYTRPVLTDLIKAFLDIYRNGSERGRCEASARLFSSEAPGIPDPAQCLQHFPASLLLRRVWPVSLAGLDAERSGPMLFDDRPFFPAYVPHPEWEKMEDALPDEPGQGPPPPGQ